MIKNFIKNHTIHPKIAKYLDIFFLLNPLYFSIIWMLICWGMAASYYSNLNSHLFYFSLSFVSDDFLFFLGLTLIISSINIKTQISELSFLDWKKNKDKFNLDLNHLYVCPNFISIKNSSKIALFLLIIGFSIIFFISLKIFSIYLIYLITSVFFNKNFSTIISFKEFILKCIFRIILFYLLFLSGWVYNNSYDLLIINTFIFIFALIPIILIYEILLLETLSDKEKVNRQFIYDKKYLLTFLSLFIMTTLFLATFYFIFYKDPIITHYSLISIPFLCYAFFRGESRDYIRSFRYSVLIINILLSWTLYPFLGIALFCIYFISKYYYWHRFNIHFPSFSLENDS